MSFFAGRYSDGKTVLSLNARSGDNAGDHYNADTNSIFHSDMPHVYITEKIVVGLSHDGAGYYVGGLGGNLTSYLNAGNRVIIPVLVYSYGGTEYRRQMTGRHEAVGYNITVGGVQELGQIISNFSGHTHPDLMLEWGTFSRTSGSWEDDIALRGTGGVNCRFIYGVGEDDPDSSVVHNWATGFAAYGPNNLAPWNTRATQRNWNPLTNSAGYPDLRVQEQQNVVDPNWIAPAGPKNRGHNYCFVRADGGRLFNYSNVNVQGDLGDARFRTSYPVNYTETLGYGTGVAVHLRGGYGAYLNRGIYPNGGTAITYPITPLRMEFSVLNLTWDPTGGYNATNIFTGQDILISNNTFSIKGQNLLANQFEFLTSVGGGAPGNNANNFFATNNQVYDMNAYPDGGSLAFAGINAGGGTILIGPSSGGSTDGSIPNWKVGTFKFPSGGSVNINSSTRTISINGIAIWAPTVRPLLLFAGNKASNVIIGQNDTLIQLGNGQTAGLNTVDMGLPAAGDTTVIMSLEYLGIDLHTSGDAQYMAGAGLRYEGGGRRVSSMDYTAGDAFQHQIIVLSPNQFVPIFTRRTISFRAGATSGGYPRGNIVYFLRKNGNGQVEFYVKSFSSVGWINVPKMRINIQRLT